MLKLNKNIDELLIISNNIFYYRILKKWKIILDNTIMI